MSRILSAVRFLYFYHLPIAHNVQVSTETRQKNIWYVLVFSACDPSHKMASVTESIEKRALGFLNTSHLHGGNGNYDLIVKI